MQDEVDLLVGEDEYLFNYIQDATTTAFKGVCDSKNCPEKVSLTDRSVTVLSLLK